MDFKTHYTRTWRISKHITPANAVFQNTLHLQMLYFKTHYTRKCCISKHITPTNAVFQNTLHPQIPYFKTHYTRKCCISKHITPVNAVFQLLNSHSTMNHGFSKMTKKKNNRMWNTWPDIVSFPLSI
jgi:hypothetical protein